MQKVTEALFFLKEATASLHLRVRLILRVIISGYKDQEFYFHCEKLLHLYAIEFCNQVFDDLHC